MAVNGTSRGEASVKSESLTGVKEKCRGAFFRRSAACFPYLFIPRLPPWATIHRHSVAKMLLFS